MKKLFRILVSIAIGTGLFVGCVGLAQAAAPMPLNSNRLTPTQSTTAGPALFDGKVLTQSTKSSEFEIGPYSICSVHYSVVQGTSVNTLTAAVKVTNWTGKYYVALSPNADVAANVLTSSVASITDVYAFNVPVVKYARLEVTLVNTNPVTVSARQFCR